jgi:hypothetical protein
LSDTLPARYGERAGIDEARDEKDRPGRREVRRRELRLGRVSLYGVAFGQLKQTLRAGLRGKPGQFALGVLKQSLP